MKKIKAYKVFNSDWTCRDFQFEIGKSYHEDNIKICEKGFHACLKLSDCFYYYNFDKTNRVAEVELFGKIQRNNDDTKCCASDIKIVKELTWEEVLALCNSGNNNSGSWNSGNNNSGNGNSGNNNSGNGNSGNNNSGSWNSGNNNSGSWNSGNNNSGSWNSGNNNSGDGNSGNRNSGDWNSGNRNSGNRNSGDWNSGNRNSGFFNTDSPLVRIFNKETNVPRDNIDFPSFFYFDLTVWVSHDTATDEEKEEHKQEIETCGGFLKTLDYKEAFKLAWDKASEEEHEQVKQLPNFDADIFYEISGIDVRGEK